MLRVFFRAVMLPMSRRPSDKKDLKPNAAIRFCRLSSTSDYADANSGRVRRPGIVRARMKPRMYMRGYVRDREERHHDR